MNDNEKTKWIGWLILAYIDLAIAGIWLIYGTVRFIANMYHLIIH